jgi:hypothetical protein
VALFSLNYLLEGREIADMAVLETFSESDYAGVGFSLVRGQRRRGQNPPARFARPIFLGRRCRDGLLDRSQATADRGVHDAGDRQRG